MKLKDKTIVITGAANGIGAAMALRFAAERPAGLLLCDLDGEGARAVAEKVGDLGVPVEAAACDVSARDDIDRVVDQARDRFGPIDLFCSNAGIIVPGDEASPVAEWDKAWSVNVIAHVHAADAVLPAMLERGSGYLLNTVSAAGLLTSLGAAPYAVSKHAALAFAEWLAITYGSRGIGVSALCPQAVQTKMVSDAMERGAASAVASSGEVITAEAVAEIVVAALGDRRFLILTHDGTQKFAERRVADTDRWIASMQKFVNPN